MNTLVLWLTATWLYQVLASSQPQNIFSCRIETKEQASILIRNYDVNLKCTSSTSNAFQVFNHRFTVGSLVDVRVRDDNEAGALVGSLPCSLKQPVQPRTRVSAKRDDIDPFFNDYHRYDEIIGKLDQFSKLYPSLTTYVPSIAVTYENRNVPAIIITDKSIPDSQKKMIWWNGMQHAREWISPAAVLFLANNLLTKSNETLISEYLKHFQFVITPMNNPDGYEYSHTTDRLWRKNRRDNGGSDTNSFGVDLNRNWDDGNWNDGNPPKLDDDGNLVVDTDYTSEVYEGPFPFSEPETNGTANFIASFPNRYAGIDFHSYGELILRSWGYTTDDSPNEAILKTLGDGIRDAIFEVHNETYTSEKASGLYLATGCADDWQSIRMGMVGFTIELRSVEYGFELPASEIIPTGEELWNGMLFYLDFLTKNPDIPPQLSDSVQPARPISIVNGNAEVNGAPGAAAVELSTQPVAVPTDGSASTAPIPFGTKISSARAWTGIVCGSLSILLLTL